MQSTPAVPNLTAGGVPAAPPTHPMPREPKTSRISPPFSARNAGMLCGTAPAGKSSSLCEALVRRARAQRPGTGNGGRQTRSVPRRSGAPSHIPNQPVAPPRRPPVAPFSGASLGDTLCGGVVLTVSCDYAGHSWNAPCRGSRPFAAGAKPHPARVARGPAFIPHNSLQLVIGYRRGLSQPVNCLSTCQTFDPRNALSGVGINDRVCAHARPGEIHYTPVSSRDFAGRPARLRRSAAMSGRSAHPVRASASARRDTDVVED